MPNFNAVDDPIGQDNYARVVAASDTPRPDAGVVGYVPAAAAHWNGGADPGNVDAGLDQLAERVSDNEEALSGLTSDHGGLDGLGDDDHPHYLLADGTRNLTGAMLVENNQSLRFRDTGQSIRSAAAGTLDLDAGSTMNLRIGGAAEAVLAANALTFQNGAVTTGLAWPSSGILGVKVGTATVATFTSFPETQLDVDGIVRGSGVRADSASPGGAANTTTLTAATHTPSESGAKPTLDRLPAGYTNGNNTGWIEFKVGTQSAVVPYWT